MKYTLFIFGDEAAYAATPPDVMQQSLAAFQAYTQSLVEAGVFVATDWLAPSSSSTTISLSGGQRLVQDGPFSETKEQIGGYYVIDVPDLDAALAWAEKCPAVYYGTVEVRPTAMG